MKKLAFIVLGAAGWNAAEYAIHRFIGHGEKRARKTTLLGRISPAGLAAEFNAEHLAHHATPTYFAPTSRKVLAAAAGMPTVALAVAPLFGVRRAGQFALGFALAYGGYEVIHRRIHTHPPTGPYSRWVRRHHLHHHHRSPRDNHGVTTPLFDRLFGTERPIGRIAIPRHVAPVWLLDEHGEVKPAFAADYELAGKQRGADASTPAVPSARP